MGFMKQQYEARDRGRTCVEPACLSCRIRELCWGSGRRQSKVVS